jgi:hypothetical protein
MASFFNEVSRRSGHRELIFGFNLETEFSASHKPFSLPASRSFPVWRTLKRGVLHGYGSGVRKLAKNCSCGSFMVNVCFVDLWIVIENPRDRRTTYRSKGLGRHTPHGP